MKKSKKLISLLLALVMLLSIIPMAVAAEDTIVEDGVTLYTTKKPTQFVWLRNNTENAITKNVGETGIYQRLPRDTRIHSYCAGTAIEFIPEYYSASATTVELSNPEILTDISYTISGWRGSDVYNGNPCLTFNYTAAKEGTTTVKLTFYYNYNCDGGYTNCQGCGTQVYIQPNTTWYQETTSFTVTVGDGEVPNPTKYTYELIHDFNYVGPGSTKRTVTATTTAESYQIDVNKGKPTRDRYKFDGWADTANATTAKYFGGELITLTKNNPTKTIYAVWKPIFDLHYNANGGTGVPESQTYTS